MIRQLFAACLYKRNQCCNIYKEERRDIPFIKDVPRK